MMISSYNLDIMNQIRYGSNRTSSNKSRRSESKHPMLANTGIAAGCTLTGTLVSFVNVLRNLKSGKPQREKVDKAIERYDFKSNKEYNSFFIEKLKEMAGNTKTGEQLDGYAPEDISYYLNEVKTDKEGLESLKKKKTLSVLEKETKKMIEKDQKEYDTRVKTIKRKFLWADKNFNNEFNKEVIKKPCLKGACLGLIIGLSIIGIKYFNNKKDA